MSKTKIVLVSNIISFLGRDLLGIYGEWENAIINNLADSDHINEESLDWINPSKANKQELAENSLARTLLVDETILFSEVLQKQKKILLVVKHPKRALAQIGNHFFVDKKAPGIHPTAIIDPEAEIGESVCVGAYCVIGKAIVGDNCVIDSHVQIYDDVTIGNHCYIKSGAVLGGAGFGFEKDEEGNKFRFPQLGSLVIGNNVEIGSNTCIDRGALSDTIIGDFTKINNLCHIAHNNRIGCNVTITGCVNISGSNVIEDEVWLAPNSSVRGFVRLGKGCIVGMGAVVTKDIPSGETWVGNPANKLK